MSDPLAELRETFFLECDELLEKLETDLLSLESGSDDPELVNSAFRAVHSIKGGAGAFGMTAITDAAHIFETAMDHVRSGSLDLDNDLCALFLRSKDLLSSLIEQENGGSPADPDEIKAVHEALEAVCPEGDEEEIPDELFKPVAIGGGALNASDTEDPADILAQFESSDDDLQGAGESGALLVAFAPGAQFFARGNDPAPFIRELCALSEADVFLDTSNIPPFDSLDPSAAYFEWQVTVDASTDPASIEDIFEFVADDCTFSVSRSTDLSEEKQSDPVPAPLNDAADFIDFDSEPSQDVVDAQPAEEPQDDEAVRAFLAAFEPDSDAEDAAETGSDTAGTEDIEKQAEHSAEADASSAPKENDAAPSEEKPQQPEAPSQSARTVQPKPVVRVELSRVDRLINLVSELVISQSMLSQAVEDQHTGTENQVLTSGLDEFRQLTRELQESVMAIRAEPVRSMFMRMGQIARTTANSCGKRVRLVTDGEQTEVDKTVIERLTEPLTHMIRNAVDHGIESNEERIASGKDEIGVVRLSADHQSGRVVLTVEDDGGGVNREKVLSKAIEKGIVPQDAQLTDSEIDQLLFAPGFSTAASVSQVSGRGVGMDVVKREITSLGGRINLTSKPGKGTTFTISLPLTLAVLDGMVIRVAEQTVVLPLNIIAESLRPEKDEIQSIGEDQVIYVRGQFVPIIDLGDALGYRAPLESYQGKVMLLVENDHGANFACAVDDIVDQRQVVIKGLQENYGRIEGVAAATILGDGQIALILDVNDLTAEQTTLGGGVYMAPPAKEGLRV